MRCAVECDAATWSVWSAAPSPAWPRLMNVSVSSVATNASVTATMVSGLSLRSVM